ncbi:MAG: WecB/TagA/CpsF family glycosyltransferase [Planctomycetaceae bacterium]
MTKIPGNHRTRFSESIVAAGCARRWTGSTEAGTWLKQYRSQLSVGVAIAAGGTIDFLAGRQRRAPRWVQKLRMEWSHRLLTNPGRLTGRYARNAWHLPRLLLQEHFARKANLRTRPTH